jgi:hypothetical protein
MEEFQYHIYQKIVTWRKNYYNIIAETKEEADAVMKESFKNDELYPYENKSAPPLTPCWVDYGDYYEGDEDVISYEMNNFRPTEELYDDDGELIIDNTPLQIKRNNIIDSIITK